MKFVPELATWIIPSTACLLYTSNLCNLNIIYTFAMEKDKDKKMTLGIGSLTYKQELDPSKSYPKDDKVRLLVGASLGLGRV